MMKIFRWEVLHLFIPVLAILFGLLFLFPNQPKLQFQIITGATMVYVSLALLHHFFDKSLTLEIFIEYILIASLVIIILQGQLI